VLIWSQDNFNIPSDATGSSIVFDNGRAATPSVRFAQATSGGLFSPAANVVAMSISGVELMRWTGTNVGIGISAPAAKLHVSGTFRAAGAVTVDAGGITVTAGGITVTAGGMTITAGGLTVTAGGATLNGNVSVAGGTFTSRGFVDNATAAAWNIDTAGRLRNNGNTQLSFSARRTTTLGATGNIVFADVGFPGGHNRATMYNVATGEATIPTGQGGDYSVNFGCFATITAAGGSVTIELRVNGTMVHTRGASGNDVGGTSGINIDTVLGGLAQGDVVTIFVASISNATIQIGANFAMRQLG
jgi:adhesin HecA-like repeat protein